MFLQHKHYLLRRVLAISGKTSKWCIYNNGDSSISSPQYKYGTMNISTYTGATKTEMLMSEGTFCYPFCLMPRRLHGFLRRSWRRFLSVLFLSSLSVSPAINQHFTRGLWKFWQLSRAVRYHKPLTWIWKFVQSRISFSRRRIFTTTISMGWLWQRFTGGRFLCWAFMI